MPPTPSLPPTPRMPDMTDPAIKEAQQKAQQAIFARSGRQSTILS